MKTEIMEAIVIQQVRPLVDSSEKIFIHDLSISGDRGAKVRWRQLLGSNRKMIIDDSYTTYESHMGRRSGPVVILAFGLLMKGYTKRKFSLIFYPSKSVLLSTCTFSCFVICGHSALSGVADAEIEIQAYALAGLKVSLSRGLSVRKNEHHERSRTG
jgi:hypothetical protein